MRGLHHQDSARFSFLIATPIILGAALHELPKLQHHTFSISPMLAVEAGLVAGVTALAAIFVLMRYFGRHDVQALDPFAYYCWAAGGASLMWLML